MSFASPSRVQNVVLALAFARTGPGRAENRATTGDVRNRAPIDSLDCRSVRCVHKCILGSSGIDDSQKADEAACRTSGEPSPDLAVYSVGDGSESITGLIFALTVN